MVDQLDVVGVAVGNVVNAFLGVADQLRQLPFGRGLVRCERHTLALALAGDAAPVPVLCLHLCLLRPAGAGFHPLPGLGVNPFHDDGLDDVGHAEMMLAGELRVNGETKNARLTPGEYRVAPWESCLSGEPRRPRLFGTPG